MDNVVARRESQTRLSLEKASGSRSFVNGRATCLYRMSGPHGVRYILESESTRAVLIQVAPGDEASVTVLDALPTRSAPDVVDELLASFQPPKPIVTEPGSMSVDGPLLTLEIGRRRLDLVVGTDALPTVGEIGENDVGLTIPLTLPDGETFIVAVPPVGVDEARKALAVVRAESAKAAEDSARRGSGGDRWQYKVVKNLTASKLEETLNAYGRSGWELVSMTGLDGVVSLTGNKLYAVMKRRL